MLEGGYTFDEERRIYVQFFRNDRVLVELVAPAEGCTLFPNSMKKMGAAPYHICYECADMEKTVNGWQEKGFLLMRQPSPAPAIAYRRVAFLYSDSIRILEFLKT